MNQDKTSSLDSYSSDGYEGFSLIDFGLQTESIQSKIIIEILFRLKFIKNVALFIFQSLYSQILRIEGQEQSLFQRNNQKRSQMIILVS